MDTLIYCTNRLTYSDLSTLLSNYEEDINQYHSIQSSYSSSIADRQHHWWDSLSYRIPSLHSCLIIRALSLLFVYSNSSNEWYPASCWHPTHHTSIEHDRDRRLSWEEDSRPSQSEINPQNIQILRTDLSSIFTLYPLYQQWNTRTDWSYQCIHSSSSFTY